MKNQLSIKKTKKMLKVKNLKRGVLLAIILLSIGGTSTAITIKSPTLFPSSVVIDDPIRRNQTVSLPTFTVKNESEFRMPIIVEMVPAKGNVKTAPSEWFKISPMRFELKPNEVRDVRVVLHISKDAEFGDYVGYLKVSQDLGELKNNMSIIPTVAGVIGFQVSGTKTFKDFWNGYAATVGYWSKKTWLPILLVFQLAIILYLFFLVYRNRKIR